MASLTSLQGTGGGRIPMGGFSYAVSRTQLAEIIGAMPSDASYALRDATRSGDTATAQRLFDKTKWLASNVDNLRHEAVAADLPGICKYAVGDWRIFYSIDRDDQIVDIHHIAQAKRAG